MVRYRWCTSTIAVLVLLLAPVSAVSDELGKEWSPRPNDYVSILARLRPLAEQGSAEAQLSLGTMFVKGQGVPRDLDAAQAWFKKAAENPAASQDTKNDAIYNHDLIEKRLAEVAKTRDTVTEDAKRLKECHAKVVIAEKLGVFTTFRVEGYQGILVAGRTFFDMPIEAKSGAIDAVRCFLMNGAEGYLPLVVMHWQTGKRVGSWSASSGFVMD